MFFVLVFSLVFYQLKLTMAQTKYPEFEAIEVQLAENAPTFKYRLLKPLGWDSQDSSQKYPLLLCLHGAGERGSDNEITLTHFAPWLLAKNNRKPFPCFVFVPQCEKSFRWVEVDWTWDTHTQPTEISVYLGYTMQVLEQLLKKYPIDEKRIYVTGLSMGGFGTWDLITRFPEKFAAAVPICGGGDETVAYKAKNVPIWAFHGALDKLVKPERSRNMIQALQKAGGKPKYTEYPQVGHDCWKNAYQEPTLLPWLFEKRKN
ncbi:MAG: prolyl oligopeptidase family serine peptidase [Bacteroidia bacterium]|nr:prolyl oligopeptidase family serine peptidase [Bacteroidia bacterium]